MRVQANELAELFGVSRRTITNWVTGPDPCPSEIGEDGVRVFDTGAVRRWLEDRAAKRALAKAERGTRDITEAKARYLAAKAEREELALARARGELLHIDDVAADLERTLQALRARILSAPSRFAPRLACRCRDIRATYALLDELCRDLIESLATIGDELAAEDEEAEEDDSNDPTTEE